MDLDISGVWLGDLSLMAIDASRAAAGVQPTARSNRNRRRGCRCQF